MEQQNFCEFCQYNENDKKGIAFCKNCFKNRKILIENSEINQISNKVFLGNEEGALDKVKLKEYGITHILICGVDLFKFYENDFQYKHILIEDEPDIDIKKYFKESFNYMESSKKVFVHCWAGVSRSASIVIAYFMWKEKLNFDNAFELVFNKRDCINPNDGFIKQLKEFEIFLIENKYKLSVKKNCKK